MNHSEFAQIIELVKQEIHGTLGPVLKLLNEDLEAAFNELNNRLNDLSVRLEKVEPRTRTDENPSTGKEI